MIGARARLQEFIERRSPLFILTGAGCSTESGIPDYRDAEGGWKRAPPMMLQTFLSSEHSRRRYWARSLIGWQRLQRALPNAAHAALACLERQGGVRQLVTQNVDRLHQAAGSRSVIDLHGRIDHVRCLQCAQISSREALQRELKARNPAWAKRAAGTEPDGDASLEAVDVADFDLPGCRDCGGVLKPDVVFFGESVPQPRVNAAMAHLEAAAGVLVVGSSLMVLSGFRFVRAAAETGKPIAAVNLGRTRADELLTLRVQEPCTVALAFLRERDAEVQSSTAMSGVS